MLIATITALIFIFGGGGLEFYLTNIKKPVKEHVQEKERREVILDESKALQKDLKAFRKDIEEHLDDLIEVHSAYTSVPADYDAAGDQLLADQEKVSARTLDARDNMKEQMTREEWDAVFKASEK